MALLKNTGSGNFTAAGTWGVVDNTSLLIAENGSTTIGTIPVDSSTFTPGAITITEIGVYMYYRSASAGTFTIVLRTGGVDVAGTSVTCNIADLPPVTVADATGFAGVWVFFRLPAPVTLLAATAYSLRAVCSIGTNVYLLRNATANNHSRMLVTTTNQAPAAGDTIYVAGYTSGAGSVTPLTVTMDNTTTTDFGNASTSDATPQLSIESDGTLTYGTAAATNYNLRVSGNVRVASRGTLELGTAGTPCPRNSTMKLHLDCVASGDFGITVRRGGTFRAYGQSRTAGKDVVRTVLTANAAVNATSLTVADDTGWLDNDVIAIAATTRTSSQCEVGALNGNAGASTLTVDGFAGTAGGLAFAHDGTGNVQADIVILTRNVQIYGTSTSAPAFTRALYDAVYEVSWVEFRYVGATSTSNKYGIATGGNGWTGTVSVTFCSIWDTTTTIGIRWITTTENSTNTGTLLVEDTVLYNTCGFLDSSGFCSISIARVTAVRPVVNTHMFGLTGLSALSSITDVRVGGAASSVVSATSTGARIQGTVSNFFIYSSNSTPVTPQFYGTLSNFTIARANSSGVLISNCVDLVMEDFTIIGCATAAVQFGSGSGEVVFTRLRTGGETAYGTTFGIYGVNNAFARARFVDCAISYTALGVTPHTTDVYAGGITAAVTVLLDNCTFGGTNLFGGGTTAQRSFAAVRGYNKVVGDHRTFFPGQGLLTTDTGTVRSGAVSLRMTPSSVTSALSSAGAYGGFKVAAQAGQVVTPSVYVQEHAAYNGPRATLWVRQNHYMGITSDTLLATATAASDTGWEELTASTAAVAADGVLEFEVRCSGTAGYIWVDDFTATAV